MCFREAKRTGKRLIRYKCKMEKNVEIGIHLQIMAYTIVLRTRNAKLLFYDGNVLFSHLKCCVKRVIP